MSVDLSLHQSFEGALSLCLGGEKTDIERILGKYRSIINTELAFPRTGWVQSPRNIPKNLAETVGAHCCKVALAAATILSGPERDKSILQAGIHDLGEGFGQAKDYTPEDIRTKVITLEGKKEVERQGFIAHKKQYSDSTPLALWEDLEENPNSVIHELDKLDAGVMAVNYLRMGYATQEFIPYTQAKLKTPLLVNALTWLQKNEIPGIDAFTVYLKYLEYRGDEERVRAFFQTPYCIANLLAILELTEWVPLSTLDTIVFSSSVDLRPIIKQSLL